MAVHLEGLGLRSLSPRRLGQATRSSFGYIQSHKQVLKGPQIAASKGFGDVKESPPGGRGPKLSKQGTVASRQGAPSRKEMKDVKMELEKSAERLEAPGPRQEVPSVVNDRILKRILVFSGVPTITGFLLLPLFYYLKVVKNVDVPNWAVLVTQTLTLGTGLLGITYGALSSSWSAGRKGSALGIEEFKTNLPLLLDRLKRK